MRNEKYEGPYDDIDEYLIEMLKRGDTRAFSALYSKYWDVLYRMALRKTNSKQTAEELIQDLFMSLWIRRFDLKLEKSFQMYLFTSMKYRIINYLKSEMIQRKYKENITIKGMISVVEEEVSYKELHQAFEREISKMPTKYQNVFLMRKRDGLSFKEISKKLEIPLSTVEKHMSKAKNLLRSNLREYTVSMMLIFQLYNLN